MKPLKSTRVTKKTKEPAKPKRGRPALGEDARTEQIPVRFSPTEIAEIDAARGDEGRATWIREASLERARLKK